jgi:putative copper resistance protein D
VDVDLISVAIRALSFVATLQAAGIAVFTALFGPRLSASAVPIRRLGISSALAGLALVLTHHALEAARMRGEFSGLRDAALQSQVLHSSTGAGNLVRAVALLVIAASLARQGAGWRLVGMLGAIALTFAFLLTGHTSTHPLRWALAPLLLIHLLIVAFWIGALPGLVLVSRRESATTATQLIGSFSAVATWLVPAIALAGLGMASLLLPSASALRQPYGMLLVVKLGVFALLMVLAALNKWRLGPAIACGGAPALAVLNRSILLEYALLVCVLAVTATLTSLYSPEG